MAIQSRLDSRRAAMHLLHGRQGHRVVSLDDFYRHIEPRYLLTFRPLTYSLREFGDQLRAL